MAWGSTFASAAGLLVAVPLLAVLSLLLLPLAILTTAFAAFALSFRALFVYLELAAGIVTDAVTGRKRALRRTVPPSSSPPAAAALSSSASRPKSVRSISSSTSSQTTHSLPANSSAAVPVPAYASAHNPLARDFEGIGGWRVAAEEDDDSDTQWLTMNSRLELPAVSSMAPEERRRHHARRSTSGSLPGSSIALAEKRKSAANLAGSAGGSGGVVRSRPVSTGLSTATASGSTSPGAVVDGPGRVKSLTAMGDTLALARGKLKHRSSTSSSGSERTLVI